MQVINTLIIQMGKKNWKYVSNFHVLYLQGSHFALASLTKYTVLRYQRCNRSCL